MAVRFYRLTKERYAHSAFSGEGARRYPGRWNPKGVPMVYCAATLSLAALEIFVHVDVRDLPDDLVTIAAELPDEAVETFDRARLPRDWRTLPGPSSLRELGAAWSMSRRTVALAVPSVIVPSELNYLLNPEHPDIEKLRRSPPEPFAFDARMRKGG